jgi:hypothetical protein
LAARRGTPRPDDLPDQHQEEEAPAEKADGHGNPRISQMQKEGRDGGREGDARDPTDAVDEPIADAERQLAAPVPHDPIAASCPVRRNPIRIRCRFDHFHDSRRITNTAARWICTQELIESTPPSTRWRKNFLQLVRRMHRLRVPSSPTKVGIRASRIASADEWIPFFNGMAA